WSAVGIAELATKLCSVPVKVTGGAAWQFVLSVACARSLVASPVLWALTDASAAATSAEKSPFNSFCVATHAPKDWPRISLFHSSFHQNHSLSFLIGPAM